MKLHISHFAVAAFACSILIAGCKKDDDKKDNSPGFDQGELLVNWGSNIILPSYKTYEKSLGAFVDLCDQTKDPVSATELQGLQAAFTQVYSDWQLVSMFEFGPASAEILKANCNTYPVDTVGLNKKISNSDFDFSAASDIKRKGLPAIDYLLFSNKLSNGKQVEMLKFLAKDLNTTTTKVVANWTSTGINYYQTYITAKGSSAGSSVSLTFNAMLQHLEKFHREAKIGIPNGERSFTGTPLPFNVEGTYQGTESLKMAIKNLKAIERLYLGVNLTGNDGVGLEENLIAINAKYNNGSLDAAIKAQFKACFDAYSKVNSPLNEAVLNNKDQVSAVFKEIQKLVVLLKTDVPSSLGILITYTDNDGD